MTIQLRALAARASLIATVAVVLVAAMVVTGRADAAGGPVTAVLAQGAGMGAKPSAQVRQLQRALRRGGYDLGAPGVDGRFGPLTAAAVRRLQAVRGLAVDGLVGERTRTALRRPDRGARVTPRRRSHAQRAASRAPASTKSSVVADASRPSTITTTIVGPDNNRSVDVVATVLGAALAAFAAFALVGLGRRASRAAPTGRRTEMLAAAEHAAWGPANAAGDAAGDGFAAVPVVDRDEVIGYVTTCSDAWSDANEGSAVAIEATCEDSDWNLLEIVCDRENGRTLDRPGLSYALQRIADGHARGLVVSDLQRLSRSPDDLGVLMAWFRDADATLVALDLDLDTSTPAGRQVARTLIALGDAEPPTARTAHNNGAEPRINGRPAVKDRPELMQRISTMRSANLSLRQIADQFNAENVPTLRGGSKWRPSSIQAALGYKRPRPRDRLPALNNPDGQNRG